MKRCVQLALNGMGRTYPNPMVGSVIVHDKTIIGEGWHRKAGQAHAEVNAIEAVEDKALLKNSTIYVSLEPCSHYGKTPPCSNLIIDSGIKKVVIGTVDPFSEVAGRGIKKLIDAGCEVIVGVREEECREINRRFFTFHLKQRPYIILKWAQTADGFLSPESTNDQKREPVWISNPYSRQLVHKWRAEEEGIIVGTNTAVADNPKLNTRLWKGRNPVRIVIDRQLRIPRHSHLFDGSTKTIVFCQDPPQENPAQNVVFEALDFAGGLAEQLCAKIHAHQVQSVIVEGGRQTLQTFIDSSLWDEALIFIGKTSFGAGTRAPEISGKLKEQRTILSDHLKILKNDQDHNI